MKVYLFYREAVQSSDTLVTVKFEAPLKVNKCISIQCYCMADCINKNPNSAFLIHTYSYI